MRISDWSSDVCSSDLVAHRIAPVAELPVEDAGEALAVDHVVAGAEVLMQQDGPLRLRRVQFAPAQPPLQRQEAAAQLVEMAAVACVRRSGRIVRRGDRKSGGRGKSVSGRVDCGGRGITTKKKKIKKR